MQIDEIIQKSIPGEHPLTKKYRDHLSDVCKSFVESKLSDSKYINELAGESHKFWSSLSEALVADLLKDKTFGQRKKIGMGPDFLIMNGDARVWIEVICPQPKNVPSDWLDNIPNKVVDYPYEAILLRWTSAIKEKIGALLGDGTKHRKGYSEAGVVGQEDSYIIAVNGCQLRGGGYPAFEGISQWPFAAEAVFPIGPYRITIDKQTLQTTGTGHSYQPFVRNKNNSLVPTPLFLDDANALISGIWALDINGSAIVGNTEHSAFIHNPKAKNPIPLKFIPADYEVIGEIDESGFSLKNVY